MYSAKTIKNSKLGEHYKDATIIRMRRVIPVKYDFLGNVDINNPKEDGQCVDEFLVKHLTNKENRRTMSEKISKRYWNKLDKNKIYQ